ncbi:MAG: diguanylate cyclase [Pseudomonadota bacterium]
MGNKNVPGKILIADGVATRRITLKTILAGAFYDVQTVSQLAQLETALDTELPDLVLVDCAMVEGNDFGACHRLLSRLGESFVPLVLFGDAPVSQQIKALQAGVEEFLSPPWKEEAIVARLRTIIRAKHTTDELLLRHATVEDLGLAIALDPSGQGQPSAPLKIVLATGEGPEGDLLAAEVKRKLPKAQLCHITSAKAVLSQFKDDLPDVTVISDKVDDGARGLKLVCQMRAQEVSRYSSILSVVETEAQGLAALGADIGASDFLMRDTCALNLVPKIEKLARRARRAQALRDGLQSGLRLAVTDTLTQWSNRRYLMYHLPRQMREAQASGQSYAGMVLDLDKFKAVNDTYGHAAGDVVLREAAGRIRACLREGDLVARLGGEEFFVGLTHTNNTSARRIAERIRTRVGAAPFRLPNGKLLTVTVSVGVAWMNQRDLDAHTLMERADQALYRSKSQGRNRVTFDARVVA